MHSVIAFFELGISGGQNGTDRIQVMREKSRIKEGGSMRKDCLPPPDPPPPPEGRKGLGASHFSLRRGARQAISGGAAAAVYPQTPSAISAFTLPGGECRALQGWSRPSLSEECGSRFRGRPGPALTPSPAVGSQEPRCLHPTLCPDPVSKSPESHFLPRPSLSSPPLPVNHLEFAFAWRFFFFFLACFIFNNSYLPFTIHTCLHRTQ